MKHLLLTAVAASIAASGLVACGADLSEPASAGSIDKMKPVQLADKAIADLKSATTLLASVNTVAEAEAAVPEFQEKGDQYAKVMAAMRNVDQTDSKAMMKMAEKSPVLAQHLQSFMAEVNAIQTRDGDAAQILLPHLKAFSGR